VNFGRVEGLKQALKDDKLVPIEKFITAEPSPAAENHDEITELYAESWGLFHYLYKFEREGMEKYLLAYKSHTPRKPISADERKTLFTNAFGKNLESLDKRFVAYVKSLPAKAN
jgi:hypothetical protein